MAAAGPPSPRLALGLAQILDGSDFERLTTRLELTTLAHDDPSRYSFVSGDAGRAGADELPPRNLSREELEKWLELSKEARDWLAVEPRPPRGD